jgi:hypothetical protein
MRGRGAGGRHYFAIRRSVGTPVNERLSSSCRRGANLIRRAWRHHQPAGVAADVLQEMIVQIAAKSLSAGRLRIMNNSPDSSCGSFDDTSGTGAAPSHGLPAHQVAEDGYSGLSASSVVLPAIIVKCQRAAANGTTFASALSYQVLTYRPQLKPA